MGLLEKMVKNARKPEGRFGRLMAKGMNKGSHAKLAIWALKHLIIKNNDVILDIGCGGGGNIKRLANLAINGKVYGIDYSEVSVEIAEKINKEFIELGRVQIKYASVSFLPFDNNTFDFITAFESYYFWPDLINDLKGIYKLLKSGGTLALINEGYYSQNEKHRKKCEKWARIGNFEIHTPAQFKEFLTKAGYSEIEIFEEEKKGWILVKCKKLKDNQ